MPREGVEPSRACAHQFLRLNCLPFQHLGIRVGAFFRIVVRPHYSSHSVASEDSQKCPHTFFRKVYYIKKLAFWRKIIHSNLMDIEQIRGFIISFFVVDSIWSVVLRGGVWFAIALVIIISTDVANPNASGSLKRNLGFFLLFLVLSGGLIYLLFGFTTISNTPSAVPEGL